MTRRLLCAVAPLVVALCGCGTQATAPRGGPLPAADQQELLGLAATLQRVDGDFAQGFVASVPDCDRACLLRGHICTLAARICGIAGRHPDDPDARERCRDAQERCRRAQGRVAERCRCL